MNHHHRWGSATPIALFVSVLLTAHASAQYSAVGLMDNPGSAASRGSLGTDSGEMLTGLHGSHWRALGDNGTTCGVDGFSAFVQDGDASTSHAYRWVVRTGTDANGPTAGAAGRIAEYPFTSPADPAGGVKAWTVTVTFGSPLTVTCSGHWSFGLGLDAAPTWPADGLSCHMTLGSQTLQHVNSIDMAWQIVNGVTSNPPGKRAWAQRVLIGSGPILQMTLDGKRSLAGLFPQSGHKVYAGNFSGGEGMAHALLFLGVGALPSGATIVPYTARLHIDISQPYTCLGLTKVQRFGDAVIPIGFVPSLCPQKLLWFQGVICGKRKEYLTNAQAATFDQ